MKKLAVLLCGAALAVSSVTFAAVSPNQVGLGRLTPGMTVDALIAAYGQPVSRHGDELIYRNFEVEVDDDRPNIVEKIETRSNTMPTPSGITVGQSATALNVLGTADKVDNDWNETEYEYYTSDYGMKMEFKVVNGVIVKIICEIRD